MKDFAEVIGGTAGTPKSRAEISATTKGKIPRPADYQYGKKLTEWESSLPATSTLSRDEFIRRVEPMHDRILVQLISTKRDGSIVLTDTEPLIGGCRKAVVLKAGPGRWIPGEWWYACRQWVGGAPQEADIQGRTYEWEWTPGYRRPVDVSPGQTVLIGNWVDLELEDIALCQEGDVRSIWHN